MSAKALGRRTDDLGNPGRDEAPLQELRKLDEPVHLRGAVCGNARLPLVDRLPPNPKETAELRLERPSACLTKASCSRAVTPPKSGYARTGFMQRLCRKRNASTTVHRFCLYFGRVAG